MKYRIIAVLLFFTSTFLAQTEVNIYTESVGSKIMIYADNPAVIPMSVDVSLDLKNMKTDFGGTKKAFVIPENSKRYKLATASAISSTGHTSLNLESFIYLGDFQKKTDEKYLYELPFESGSSYMVSQGYNGKFSHRGENAIDFALSTGEKVFAARGGIVYGVVEKNSKSCRHSSCQAYNNHITIYHSDGTFSEYSHLDKNGAIVNVGDRVKAGDHIGYSGNTGWSSGPHLHFVVYNYNNKGRRKTIKTKFKTSEKDGVYLKERKRYTKL